MADVEAGRLAEAVQGDLRTALEALRDVLAREIDGGVRCKACGGSVSSPTAALAKQLRDTLTQLRSMPAKEASKVESVAAKRARRRAKVSDAPPVGRQRGARSGGAGSQRGSGT